MEGQSDLPALSVLLLKQVEDGIKMKEIWKPIEEYERLYEVSNLGNVKSLPRNGTIKKAKLLRVNVKKSGYVNVVLTKNNKKKTFRLHRLVAKAFIPNPQNKPQVNHKNGIKTDNTASNLEWATSSENVRHKYNVLGYNNKPVNPKPVICIDTGDIYGSIKEAERIYGKNYGAIQHAVNGKTKTAYNLHWKFIELPESDRTL